MSTHLEHPLGRRRSRGLPRRGLALLRSAIVGLCLALASARGAALTPSDITDLYSDAKRCFREATALAETQPDAARDLFAKAALRFERLAREGGIRNGRLYYNLGNCYFRMEDLGRAILYYRRAEQYIPNDPNLRQNLDFARRKRLDRIDVPERTQALRTVLFFHYDLGQRARARIVALGFAALWVLLTLRIRVRSGWLSWAAAGFGVVSVLMLGSLAVEWQQMRSVRPGVVIAAETTARKGDGTSYEPAFTQPLHAGTEFRILEDRGEWVEVALDDGRRCWLPAADVEPVR